MFPTCGGGGGGVQFMKKLWLRAVAYPLLPNWRGLESQFLHLYVVATLPHLLFRQHQIQHCFASLDCYLSFIKTVLTCSLNNMKKTTEKAKPNKAKKLIARNTVFAT